MAQTAAFDEATFYPNFEDVLDWQEAGLETAHPVPEGDLLGNETTSRQPSIIRQIGETTILTVSYYSGAKLGISLYDLHLPHIPYPVEISIASAAASATMAYLKSKRAKEAHTAGHI